MGNNLVKISKNMYALRFSGQGKKEAAIVTIGANSLDVANASKAPGKKGTHIVRGEKDDILFTMHKIASESPNKWRLIKTRRDFVVGKGVYPFKLQGFDPITKKPIENEVIDISFNEFKERVELDDVIAEAGLEQAFANDVFVKITLGLNRKIESYDVISCFHIRVEKPEDSDTSIKNYLINPNFGTKRFKVAENVSYPAFDSKDPTKYPVSIIHLRDKLPGQEYYQMGDWWGTLEWTQVANKIPKFHDAGLDNGYNIKYHISIPDNYFAAEGLNEEEQEALKEETLDAMGDSLSGIENVDKVLYTFHGVDGQGREMQGVKITPLANLMSDDAYTALFNTANVAQASGHGVLPTLAGIDTGGKLGGSGKELEVAANYQQGFMTFNDRRLLSKLCYIAKKIEGWALELEFNFRDIHLYTPDVTPVSTGNNPN
jgi:hypothetical protein